MQHVAEPLGVDGGAFLVRGLRARRVPIGLPGLPESLSAGVAPGPHPPGLIPVDGSTAALPRARLAGTRCRRSPGREGTCRSPT